MSVFKEKNGKCEGANLLCEEARFQVCPGRFRIGRGLSLDSQFIRASRRRSVSAPSERSALTIRAGVFEKGGDREKRD
jgi:hypothetical protein